MTETFKKMILFRKNRKRKASMPKVCVLTRLFGFL